jgi:hypothetical protein
MVEPIPNVSRRFAEFCDRPVLPRERAMTARLFLEEMTSNAGGETYKHHARNLDVGMQSTM